MKVCVNAFHPTICVDFLLTKVKEKSTLYSVRQCGSQLYKLFTNIPGLGKPVDFSTITDPHVITNILKQYLRELPEPLLTFHLYQQFIKLAETEENAASAMPKIQAVIQKYAHLCCVYVFIVCLFVCSFVRSFVCLFV